MKTLRTRILLDLPKIEAGKLEVFLEPVAPSFLSLQASTTIKSQADAAGLALAVEVPEDLPEVLADPNKIVWVLVNLLGNAVRYTPSGGHYEVRDQRKEAVTNYEVAAKIDLTYAPAQRNLERAAGKPYTKVGIVWG